MYSHFPVVYHPLDHRPEENTFPTFAIHRLLAWYQEGKDLNAYLPALATYLGHVNVSSTQVYLEPTPELLHQAGDRFAKYCREHLFSKGVSS